MAQIQLPHDHGQSMEHQLDTIPTEANFQTVAELFKQLGDGNRLRVFWILCHGEECLINLSAMMQMSSPALSHHLKLLREARLIVSQRRGKEVYYRASDTAPARALHRMIEQMVQITCPDENAATREASHETG